MTNLTEAAVPSGGRKLPDGTFVTPEGLHVSRTGAVMGRPEAEHSQYGLVREDDSKADKLTEPEIRGSKECVDDKPRT